MTKRKGPNPAVEYIQTPIGPVRVPKNVRTDLVFGLKPIHPHNVAIYLVAAGPEGPCKIGQSKNPLKRLEMLQTGSHCQLTLEMVQWVRNKELANRIEKQLHADCANYALEGEWFSLSVEHLLSTLPSSIKYMSLE